MSIQHIKSNTIADFTGTVTVFDSMGATVTANATDLVRPVDWNSAHNLNSTFLGNTAGVSTISGTNIVLAGGNNVTLSANGSTVSINGPNTVAQTQYVFSNANGVTFGTAGSTVTATVVTSYQPAGAYLTTARASNDAIGLNTALTANGLSVTANSSGLSINVPPWITTYAAQSTQTQPAGNIAGSGYTSTTQAGSTLGITHNSNGLSLAQPPFITTYVAQSTQTQPAGNIAGVGTSATNASITLNSNGLAISVAAPGGGGGIAASIGGGNSTSAGAGYSNITSGTLLLYGGNNVTLSQNGPNITISGGAAGGADGINALVVNGGASTASTTLALSNSNNVSFGLNAGTITASASYSQSTAPAAIIYGVATQTNGSVWLSGSGGITVTNNGNTAIISFDGHHMDAVLPSGNGYGTGFSSMTSGTFGLNVIGELSMSQNANNLTISGPAQTVQPAVAQLNGSSGTLSLAVGSSLSASTNGSTITFGLASNITTALQSAGAYLTTAMQSQSSSVFAKTGYTSTTQAGSTVGITHDTNGLSAAWPPFLTAAAGGGGIAASLVAGGNSTSAGAGYSNITSGTMFLAGGNNITLSQNGASITISGNTQSVQPAVGQLNGSSGTMSLVAGSSLSASTNGSTITFGLASNWSTTIMPLGNSTAYQSSVLSNTFLTTAANSTHTHTANLYVPSNSTQLSSTAAVDLRSLSFGGAGIASVGVSGGSVLISVPAGGGAAFSAGATTDALGTTGLVGAQIVFYEGNTNITLSQSINGQSASLSILGPNPGGGGAGWTGFWFQPEVYGNTMTSTLAPGTVYIRPFEIDGYYDADRYILQQFISSQLTSTHSFSASVSAGNASSGTGSWGCTGTVVMFTRVNTNETNASYQSLASLAGFSDTYSFGAGYSASVSWSTNVSSATASWTTSGAVSYIKNIDGAGGFTSTSSGTSGSSTFSSTSNAANSFSSSYAMSFPYAHLSGMRPVFVPGPGAAMTPGEYWIGIQHSTQTGSTNMSLQRPLMYASQGALFFTASSNNSYLEMGNSANIVSSNWRPGFGSLSASSLTTGTFGLTAITSMASNASIYFAIDGKTQ